jgi:hypothetical protein
VLETWKDHYYVHSGFSFEGGSTMAQVVKNLMPTRGNKRTISSKRGPMDDIAISLAEARRMENIIHLRATMVNIKSRRTKKKIRKCPIR